MDVRSRENIKNKNKNNQEDSVANRIVKELVLSGPKLRSLHQIGIELLKN